MSCDVASIYPHHFPTSWCHLFFEVHRSLPQQSTPTTWCCHPVLHGWEGVLRLASLPLFPPNITMVIMAKQFYFCYIRPEDISPKSTIFVPMCRSLAFLWWFWSNGFFLAERPFRLCRYRTRFTVYIDTFVTVSFRIFTRSFAVVLGLNCTFRILSWRQNASPSWWVWRLSGPMVFILVYYCLYRWMW